MGLYNSISMPDGNIHIGDVFFFFSLNFTLLNLKSILLELNRDDGNGSFSFNQLMFLFIILISQLYITLPGIWINANVVPYFPALIVLPLDAVTYSIIYQRKYDIKIIE